MTKEEIRNSILLKRNQLSYEDVISKSRKIFLKITVFQDYMQAENILVYASMRSEVITDEIILDALSLGKRVFCPRVVDRKKGKMIFVPIDSLEDLRPGYFGIREPDIPQGYTEQELEGSKTLVIVPGVAFDKNRNRIGYSGGFYDRYLSGHGDYLSVAIAFQCQVTDMDIVPDAFDIRPDRLFTEENVY